MKAWFTLVSVAKDGMLGGWNRMDTKTNTKIEKRFDKLETNGMISEVNGRLKKSKLEWLGYESVPNGFSLQTYGKVFLIRKLSRFESLAFHCV